MKRFIKGNRGIGLIEILITMGVLAVGILGIAGLNSVITRQSQDNKAQSEALVIAQSRIEDVLNYTNQANSPATFNTLFTPITDGNILTPINGANAVFTRTETITNNLDDKNLEVTVSWTDANGIPQEVSLNTTIAYISPRSVGDDALAATPPIVNSPTGRATLGQGTMPPVDPTTLDNYQLNDDKTQEYRDGDDKKLADADGNVVLTLESACQSENECLDFVRIKGTVYLNTIPNANQRPDIGNILLLASDAAYCTRYYTDANGITQNVTALTTSVETVGQYAFFHYTCYLGGGWHGNIGLLFAGNDNANNNNKGHRACVGDPTPTADALSTPRVAVRRAYRGMLYKKGPNDTKEQILNNAQDGYIDRVYSHGIMDGAVLGETNGHDFVIGKIIEPVNVDDNDCETVDVMTATGSTINGVTGDRFAGMPRDFFCLNEGYLDTVEDDIYGVFEGPINGCPYDPTNPPAKKFLISGIVRFIGAENSSNQILVDGIGVETSEGHDTCALDPFAYDSNGYYQAPYTCGVYAWTAAGWSGSIEANYDSASMICTPSVINLSGVTANDSGNDFTNCGSGTAAVFTGTVTQAGNGNNSNKIISVAPTMTGTGSSMGIDGTCSIAIDGLSYTCTSSQYTGTWAGDIVFTTGGNNKICPATAESPKTISRSNISPGNHTLNLIIVGSNGNGC